MGATDFASPDPRSGPDDVVASPDARFVALGSTSRAWSADGNSFVIRDVDSGVALATIRGGVAAFSDDDSRVLTVTYVGNSNERAVYRLVDWRTGQELWNAELPPSSVKQRPGGGDLLIEPWDYRPIAGSNTRQPFTRPFVVHPDGSTTMFETEVRPLDE